MKGRNKLDTIDEYIIEKLLEYISDMSLEERYRQSLVISDTLYESMTEEQQKNLRNTIQLECRGKLTHNSWVDTDFVGVVNTYLGVGSPNKLHKIDIRGIY